jgi:Mg2+ and Co2+ transporter CorA
MLHQFSRFWRLATGRPQLGDTAEGRAVADAWRVVADYQREIAELRQDRTDALREDDSELVEDIDRRIKLGYEMLEHQKREVSERQQEYTERRALGLLSR